MKANLRRIVCAALVGTLTVGTIPAVGITDPLTVLADEIEDKEKEKEETQNKKAEAEEELDQLNTEKSALLDTMEELDAEITSYEDKIRELNSQKNELQTEITVTENSLQTAYIEEANQYDSMKERIQFAYENGDVEYLEVLMSVKNYDSILNQSEYVEKVSEYDQQELEKLAAIEQKIADSKASLEESLTQIQSLKAEAEEEQAALEVVMGEKEDTLAEYNASIAETEYTIEELEALEAQQESELAALEAAAAERRKAAEAAAAAAAAATTQTITITEQVPKTVTKTVETASGTDATVTETVYETVTKTVTVDSGGSTVSTPNSYSGGSFVWPTTGGTTISSYFGPRTSPTAGASSYHKGIDIPCAIGSSVLAAADGVVSYAGYISGGGNCVMIDHGNGLSTVYMHLSGYAASVGDNVTAGQLIAYSGNTGVSTGPHLHFAVRVNGSYVNPLSYL